MFWPKYGKQYLFYVGTMAREGALVHPIVTLGSIVLAYPKVSARLGGPGQE